MHTISIGGDSIFTAETQRVSNAELRIPDTVRPDKFDPNGRWDGSPYNCPLRNYSRALLRLRICAVIESLS